MARVDIPIGRLFPADKFTVTYKNGVVSALPKGEHTYIVGGSVEKCVGIFPHVSMIPYNQTEKGQAKLNAGRADFVMGCFKYHVTGTGQARIWRQFEDAPCLRVVHDPHNADSNLGVTLLKDLNNRFLNALEKAIDRDISGA